MKRRDRGNIVRFHRKIQFNIGFIIAIFILAYVVFHIFSYFTEKKVTVYEVNQGSITTDNRYRALAIRNETLIPAPSAGKIVYLSENKSRVGVKSLVCSIDANGDIASLISGSQNASGNLTEEDLSDCENAISVFTAAYRDLDFSSVYSFKNALSENLNTAYGRKLYADNSDAIAAAVSGGTFINTYAPQPGLLVLSMDGMEGVQAENVTSDMFDMKGYAKTNFSSDTEVKAGDPVFKLICDDNWQIVMPISQETKQALQDKSYVDVSFSEDKKTATGAVSLSERAGQEYLTLTFDDSMERYADSRFLTVSLLLDKARGLKIPKSAIVKKQFYGIPKACFLKGDDSSDFGVLVDKASGDAEFTKPTVYFEDEDNYYTDDEVLKAGDRLSRPSSSEKFTFGDIKTSRKGVYNVNKGYAVFKLIDILYEGGDYCIVDSGTNYGISLYDHIVLQGDSVSENTLIY